MEKAEIEKIVKGFQEMKPSQAFKKIDFTKLPKEVREQIKSQINEFSSDGLDLAEDSPTYKRFIKIMSDSFPSAFGIKITKPKPQPQEQPKVAEQKQEDPKEKVQGLELRLSVIKKMLKKERNSDKKEVLRVRLKIVGKMLEKAKQNLKSQKKNKKSLGGFLIGAAAGFVAGQMVDLKLSRKKVRFDLGGTVGTKKYLYSVTFETISPESAEVGDFESTGFEVEDSIDELQDILSIASYNYGINQKVSDASWSSSSPTMDKDYFEKGIEKYYTLFVKNIDGSPISIEEESTITEKLKEGRKLSWDEEGGEWYRSGGTIYSSDNDGKLVFNASTKGGKYSIEVRESDGYYSLYEYTNGRISGMGSYNNGELIRYRLMDTIVNSKKIDKINYLVQEDELGVLYYLDAYEKICDIYDSPDMRNWFSSLSETEKNKLLEKSKQDAIAHVKNHQYNNDDSTVGSFFNIFRKQNMVNAFHSKENTNTKKDISVSEWKEFFEASKNTEGDFSEYEKKYSDYPFQAPHIQDALKASDTFDEFLRRKERFENPSYKKGGGVTDDELEQLKEVHEKIRQILMDSGNEEYGDFIIDEISAAVGISNTISYYKEDEGYVRPKKVILKGFANDKNLEELKGVHEKIRQILIDNDSEEYGDVIIDEISEAVGIPPTSVYHERTLPSLGVENPKERFKKMQTDGNVGDVWLVFAKTKDNILLSERFDKSISHHEVYKHYKEKGYEIVDSKIFKATNKDVVNNFMDAVSVYIKEVYQDTVDWGNSLLSFSMRDNRIEVQRCFVVTQKGKEYELTPSDLVDKKYATGGKIDCGCQH